MDWIALAALAFTVVASVVGCTFYLATRIERIHSLAKSNAASYAKHEDECDKRWVRCDDRFDHLNRQLSELARVNLDWRETRREVG